jgi:predicted transcriptional regulator
MFTMEEYIAKNKLGVSITDPQATRIISKHLIEQGYVKQRKKGRYVWVSRDSVPDYKELKAKLGKLK